LLPIDSLYMNGTARLRNSGAFKRVRYKSKPVRVQGTAAVRGGVRARRSVFAVSRGACSLVAHRVALIANPPGERATNAATARSTGAGRMRQEAYRARQRGAACSTATAPVRVPLQCVRGVMPPLLRVRGAASYVMPVVMCGAAALTACDVMR